MNAPLCFLLLILPASFAAAQSPGVAPELLGEAFKSSFTDLKPVPGNDRRAVISYATQVMRRLVTIRDDGTAATTHHIGGSKTHIEWRGLRLASLRPGQVTPVDRSNGISRKSHVALACDTHRTWNRTTSRWSEWRSGGYVLFPSTLLIQERNGHMEVGTKFHGTFGRGPGSPVAIQSVKPDPTPAPPSKKHRHMPPDIKRSIRPAPESLPEPEIASKPTRRVNLFELLGIISIPGFIGAVFIIGTLVLVKISGHPKSKGWLGERRVRRILRTLDPTSYRSHHDLYIPRHDSEDLTQIDHVVISPSGIFVIETKNYTGWIFGSEKQREWTQQIYRKKSRFSNPLHQNNLHVNSLAAYLGLAKNRFHSLVFFAGDATLKSPMPDNVIHQGLARWILSRNKMLLTPPELETARAKLAELDRCTDRRASTITHEAAIQARHC